jgi:hypothetical protein
MSAAEIGHKGGGTMDKKIRLWGTVTLVGAFVCLSWVVFDIFTFAHLKARLHLPGQWGSLQQTLGGLVWLGYFVFFLFHIPALMTLIVRLQVFKKVDSFLGGTFLLGVVSLFCLIGDYGLLNDIGRETRLTGQPQEEWTVLTVVLAIHALFVLLMIFLIFQTFRRLKRESTAEPAVKDDVLFLTAQWMGVVCGAVGLLVNFSFYLRQIPSPQYVLLLPFYLLLFLPYGLAALSWLVRQRETKPSDWYDEKQWGDITHAALATIILSIPGMAVLLLFRQPLGMFWFPHYLFLTLLLFSGCTLFLSLGRGQDSVDGPITSSME